MQPRQRGAIATSDLLVLDVAVGDAARLDVDTPGGYWLPVRNALPVSPEREPHTSFPSAEACPPS
ncbi:hypothetical protein ACC717_38535, partial [Rhizobium ruizarguesonis]